MAYPDRAAAFRGIQDGLTAFYKDATNVPKASVDRAVATAQHVFERNVFPAMNVTGERDPNNVGHSDPGPGS